MGIIKKRNETSYCSTFFKNFPLLCNKIDCQCEYKVKPVNLDNNCVDKIFELIVSVAKVSCESVLFHKYVSFYSKQQL